MSRKLFGWFAPKRGEEVLAMAEKHLELTKGAVMEMYSMVDAAAHCDAEKCSTHYISLSRMEMEADELRRQMVDALTKSEMFPEERDDLMELVRAVDWIADWSKEAGRITERHPPRQGAAGDEGSCPEYGEGRCRLRHGTRRLPQGHLDRIRRRPST